MRCRYRKITRNNCRFAIKQRVDNMAHSGYNTGLVEKATRPCQTFCLYRGRLRRNRDIQVFHWWWKKMGRLPQWSCVLVSNALEHDSFADRRADCVESGVNGNLAGVGIADPLPYR